MKKKQEEAKGKIRWIDENCVCFQCECGMKLMLGEYPEEFDGNACSKCGREYILVPMYKVYEKED